LHQGAKIPPEQREEFFDWLYEYEFDLIGLPRPDTVIYFNTEASLSLERLRSRQSETGTNADIHEQDLVYLENCVQCGRQAAAHFGWQVINCISAGNKRTKEDIHKEIYQRLFE